MHTSRKDRSVPEWNKIYEGFIKKNKLDYQFPKERVILTNQATEGLEDGEGVSEVVFTAEDNRIAIEQAQVDQERAEAKAAADKLAQAEAKPAAQ